MKAMENWKVELIVSGQIVADVKSNEASSRRLAFTTTIRYSNDGTPQYT